MVGGITVTMHISGMIPLMYAARRNASPSVVQELLAAGANLEASDIVGQTPLMHAASKNEKPEVLWLLLDAGANPRATDQTGLHAIDYARKNEHLRGTDANWRLNAQATT